MRTWILLVCHECGFSIVKESSASAFQCDRCGEGRRALEEVEVQEVPRDPDDEHFTQETGYVPMFDE